VSNDQWRPFEPCAENAESAQHCQCRMVALRSGWNCCVLEDGHDGEHQSDGGCTKGPWATREDARAFFAAQYGLPRRRK
jgi:hypothetical protein